MSYTVWRDCLGEEEMVLTGIPSRALADSLCSNMRNMYEDDIFWVEVD